MTRRRLSILVPLVLLAACSAGDTTAPRSGGALGIGASSRSGYYDDGRKIPGSGGQAGVVQAANHPLACTVAQPLSGSAVIGPNGGVLAVGPHVLIVPPGALNRDTLLSATVPAGNTFRIDFAPHGLQFRKPAGLIIDASSCGNVPNIVYLNEQGGIAEHITAVFSNWWHAIAAPIDHFSGYMLEV